MKQCERKIAPISNRVCHLHTISTVTPFMAIQSQCGVRDGDGLDAHLALYYFTIEDRPDIRSTEYRHRPGEGPKAVLIYLDKQLLRIYDRNVSVA